MSRRGELSTRTPTPTHPAPTPGRAHGHRSAHPAAAQAPDEPGLAVAQWIIPPQPLCGRTLEMAYFLALCLKSKPDPFIPSSRRNGARGGRRRAGSWGQWGGHRRGLARPPQACWELARRVPPRRRGLFGGDFGRRPDAAFSENSALCSEALCVWRGRVSPAGSEAPRSPHLLPLLPRRRSRSFSRSVRVCVGPCYHRMWKLISSLVKNNSTSPGTQIIPAISCLLH